MHASMATLNLNNPKLPILIHLLVETPASLSFLLAPQSQLPRASPEARLILRNLGGLLLATNLVCLAFLARPVPADEQLTAAVCVGLGTYHVWPAYRAYARIVKGVGGGGGPRRQQQKKVLGGPVVHLVAHLLCLVALVGGGWAGLRMGRWW